jgi:transposase
MDETAANQAKALKTVKQLGRKYPEIKEFTRIPGVGQVLAHTFDAYIQTPHRFANKRQLWKYCRLGITDRSSDNKPLGYKRLDRSGVGELKALSYRAWLSAMNGDNEVKQFYHQSAGRTRSRVHARLNTQRKILAAMYGIWKTGTSYSKEQFLDSSQRGVA